MDWLIQMPPVTCVESFGAIGSDVVVTFREINDDNIQLIARRTYHDVTPALLEQLRTLPPMQGGNLLFRQIDGWFRFTDELVPEYIGTTDVEELKRIAAQRRAARSST